MKLGISINLSEPALIEIAGWLGCEFVWIDSEHSTLQNLSELVRAAEAVGVEPWVRVPYNHPQIISSTLAMGAKAIIVPHVKSVSDAQEAVKNCKFYPMGLRNWFSKARDARYGLGKVPAYLPSRNASARLIAQVEDPEGIRDIAQIAAVAGVDMIMTGPGDLSQALGIPGKLTDARIMHAEEAAFCAADAAGKPVLHFASTAQELRDLQKNHPVEYVCIGGDASLFISALKAQVAEIRGIE